MGDILPFESVTAVDRYGISYTIKWPSEGSESELAHNRVHCFDILKSRMLNREGPISETLNHTLDTGNGILCVTIGSAP